MVRFKNRYLLFEIIYADTPLGWTSIPAATTSAIEAANQSLGPNLGVFGDTGRNNCRLPPISSKDLINTFRNSIGDNFGDYGSGITQRGLVLKYFSPHTNIGILRISREEMHIAWGALTFIKELKGRPCIIKVLHTSGTAATTVAKVDELRKYCQLTFAVDRYYILGTIKHCQLTTIRYDRDRIMFLRNQAQLLNDSQTYTQLGLAFKDSADEVNALEV